jgi:hypothetical protein
VAQQQPTAPPPLTPARQLAGFIAKFEPSRAKIIRGCRTELRHLMPTAIELVYDNYNFLAIGYSSTQRPSDCIVSIAAGANGVSLSFYYGTSLDDPHHLLLGEGKQNRFLRLPNAEVLRDPQVVALIQTAINHGTTPLPDKPGVRTIIKSISAKQNPRRKP